jgi:hypothetical protein
MDRAVRCWLVVLLTSGCSGSNGGGGDGPTTDDPLTGGSDTGGLPVGTTTYVADASVGFVFVSSGEVPSNGPNSTATAVTAGFVTDDQQVACTRRTLSADCSDVTCARTGATIPSSTLSSAGVIDIAGLRDPVQLVEGDGVYEGFYSSFYVSNEASYYVPGEDVTVTASGDAVAAFSLTATTPDQNLVLIDVPSSASRASLVPLPLGTDLQYVWAPPNTGRVTVALDVLTGSPTLTRRIACRRLGTPLIDEVVIPLSEVDDFNAGTVAFETISYAADATTVAGDFPVTLELVAPVVTEDGSLVTFRTLSFD